MKIWVRWCALGALAGAIAAAPAVAQDARTAERLERLEAEIAQLRRQLAARDTIGTATLREQVDILTRQLEELRLGGDVAVAADTTRFGLAPAASKVYRAGPGVSIGGYGEILYENFASERQDGAAVSTTDQLDALRAILYVGYKFNERLLFNSEIEVEHGSTDQGGSVSLEFAYVDYFLTNNFGLRAGLLLIPVGLVNELHEPPVFLGSKRPETEQVIIPTTWRESGVGIFGEAADFSFRAYLINGLDAVGGGTSRAGGFSASGLRGGRQKGARAVVDEWAGVARVDYTGFTGLMLGGSLYRGDSGQGRVLATDSSRTVDATTTIWEGHADYKAYGLDLRALYAVATVSDAATLNEARKLSGNQSVGERLAGGYVHAGYDVLRGFRTEHQLIPYVRYERLNTQAEVPTGFAANAANAREILLLGTAWRPIPNVIVKADYEINQNDANAGVNQFNIALGYLF